MTRTKGDVIIENIGKYKPSDFRIGDKVHHNIYPPPHAEVFTVVGIKEDEIALKGDWSGGVRPIDDVSWVKYYEVIKKAEESEDELWKEAIGDIVDPRASFEKGKSIEWLSKHFEIKRKA